MKHMISNLWFRNWQSLNISVADEDCDWLHTNDMYQMQKIGGRMRPENILTAPSCPRNPVDKYNGNLIDYHLVHTFHSSLILAHSAKHYVRQRPRRGCIWNTGARCQHKKYWWYAFYCIVRSVFNLLLGLIHYYTNNWLLDCLGDGNLGENVYVEPDEEARMFAQQGIFLLSLLTHII